MKKPVPVCESRLVRNYSIIKLPVENINAVDWKPITDKIVNLPCISVGYGENDRGIFIMLYFLYLGSRIIFPLKFN